MQPPKTRMSLNLGKRKVFAAVLMSISVGGCASSDRWRPKFAEQTSTQPAEVPGGVSWEQAFAEASVPASGVQVQPVGYGDGAVVALPRRTLRRTLKSLSKIRARTRLSSFQR